MITFLKCYSCGVDIPQPDDASKVFCNDACKKAWQAQNYDNAPTHEKKYQSISAIQRRCKELAELKRKGEL